MSSFAAGVQRVFVVYFASNCDICMQFGEIVSFRYK